MNRYAFFKSKKKFYSEKCRLERTAGLAHFWPFMVHIFVWRDLEAPIHTQRGAGVRQICCGAARGAFVCIWCHGLQQSKSVISVLEIELNRR